MTSCPNCNDGRNSDKSAGADDGYRDDGGWKKSDTSKQACCRAPIRSEPASCRDTAQQIQAGPSRERSKTHSSRKSCH